MTCKRQNLLTIWLLTVVVIMTPWLSFWATPVMAGAPGERVALCTLQGAQTVLVDNAGNILEQSTEHCSALQLIKAFGQTPPPNFPDSGNTLPHTPQCVTHPDYFYRIPLLLAYSGRAPPAV